MFEDFQDLYKACPSDLISCYRNDSGTIKTTIIMSIDHRSRTERDNNCNSEGRKRKKLIFGHRTANIWNRRALRAWVVKPRSSEPLPTGQTCNRVWGCCCCKDGYCGEGSSNGIQKKHPSLRTHHPTSTGTRYPNEILPATFQRRNYTSRENPCQIARPLDNFRRTKTKDEKSPALKC